MIFNVETLKISFNFETKQRILKYIEISGVEMTLVIKKITKLKRLN
jgi:hypothetical protein